MKKVDLRQNTVILTETVKEATCWLEAEQKYRGLIDNCTAYHLSIKPLWNLRIPPKPCCKGNGKDGWQDTGALRANESDIPDGTPLKEIYHERKCNRPK